MASSLQILRPDLRRRVTSDAENRPGVYRFLGPRGEVLYIGKSVRVRTRLLSYFRGEKGGKEAELLRTARDVEWDYAPNEFEALLRELRLIQSFRPRFNVRHRRRRRFSWIRITPGPAPRLAATRSPRADGSRYFGPFPASRQLPRTLGELAHAIGLRDCPDTTPIHFADQLDLLGALRTPACIRGEVGSCPAPCAALCTRAEYREGVQRAEAFLAGESDEPVRLIRTRMESAARAREFERAARLRDRAQRLEELQERVVEFRHYLERLSFIYHVPGQGPGEDRDYLIVEGRVRHTFRDREGPDQGLQEPALRRIRGIMQEPPIHPWSLSATQREELFLVIRWFRRHPEELARTHPLESSLIDARSELSRQPPPTPG